MASDIESKNRERAARYVVDHALRARVPGAAAVVVTRDATILECAVGTDVRTRPMSVATPITIGSTAKSVTALAVMQLVENRRLRLDTRICEVLPWFRPVDSRAQQIQVRHLLTHTSGISTWAGWQVLSGSRRQAMSIRFVANNLRLASPVGDRFRYSWPNYVLLGQVIESCSRLPYDVYVQRHIFAPLGMVDSSARPTAAVTRGHQYWFGYPMATMQPLIPEAASAGYMTSSARDLGFYAMAHLGGARGRSLLSHDGYELLHSENVRTGGFMIPTNRHYAMGWYVGTVAKRRAFFHSGDVFNSSSAIVVLPDDGIAIAVVATSNDVVAAVAHTLAHGLTAQLVGQPPPDLARLFRRSRVGLTAVIGLASASALRRASALDRQAARPRRMLRMASVDLLCSALVVGLPAPLFSRLLDKAERVTTLRLWLGAYRVVPDATLALLGIVSVRAGLALRTVARAVRTLQRRRTSRAGSEP